MATESEILAAALAKINTGMPAARQACEPSKVATERPPEYLTVTLARRPGGSPRAGRHSTTGWALYLFAASSTEESNARNSLEKARAAIENEPLVVGDETSTPVRFDNARPVSPDDGWFSGSNVYHFAL
jgi:hypothetical protein